MGRFRMHRQLAALLALSAVQAVPAKANDSIAELGTGGLVLARTDAVAMQKEVLFVSREKVEVDYVFQNISGKDVDTLVAFPMPDIDGNPYSMPAIPVDNDPNFLGFSVTIDGKPVTTTLDQRAFAVGVDVTEALKAQNVPLYPEGNSVIDALQKVPDAVAADWIDRGIILIDEYDDGSGWKRVRTPFWTLKSTYWWRSFFPAGKDVKVSHRYKPSVGASVMPAFFVDGKIGGEGYQDYKQKYCMDAAFERAVERAAKENPDGYPKLTEYRVSYILRTGGNWAFGMIGDFTATIDKGNPRALVSFCGEGVRKSGPTSFTMAAKDFLPDRDLDVLILEPWTDDMESGEPARGVKPAAPSTGSGG